MNHERNWFVSSKLIHRRITVPDDELILIWSHSSHWKIFGYCCCCCDTVLIADWQVHLVKGYLNAFVTRLYNQPQCCGCLYINFEISTCQFKNNETRCNVNCCLLLLLLLHTSEYELTVVPGMNTEHTRTHYKFYLQIKAI